MNTTSWSWAVGLSYVGNSTGALADKFHLRFEVGGWNRIELARLSIVEGVHR